jgi:hypothetical protein
MRRAFLGILVVLACGAVFGQVKNAQPFSAGRNEPPPEILPPFDTLEEQGRYLAVKHFMSYPRPLSPVGDFTLWAMGDEIATYFNLILERRPPLSDEETLRALDMIHTAFRDPKFIHLCSNRNPEKTLALLETMQVSATDQFTKENIAAATGFFADYVASEAPVLSHLPCNMGPPKVEVDLSVPANDLPAGAIVDPFPSTPSAAMPAFIRAEFASISAYMRLPRPLQIGDTYLAALGDEAAFHIFGFIFNNPPLTTPQMLTSLDIIHKSFANPMAIQNGASRRPEKTMALFKILQAGAIDQTVKDRIAMETDYLNNDMPKKIYAPWKGIADPPLFLPKP